MKTIKVIFMYKPPFGIRTLTHHKVYEVVSETEEYYRVIDDEGFIGGYPKEAFEIWEEVVIPKQEYEHYRDTLEWIRENGDKQSAAMATITLSNYKKTPAPVK